MKKLINAPERVVEEMLEGLAALDPSLRKLPGKNVLVRRDAENVKNDRVAIISGGGSGHEPAHAGYVGKGMLSAAVAGEVFTSPSPDAVLAAIKATAGSKGALLIVKNYTGDRLNFGLAAEQARLEGIAVEMVIVADDVALADSNERTGRRGLAGTLFVHKIAGAASEEGKPLVEVAALARSVAEAVRTMGVALSPCTVPGASQSSFTLEADEIELGLGIHGEAGARKMLLEPADAIVDRLLDAILSDAKIPPNRRIALLVNNLGGATGLELAIVARRAIARLEQEKLILERAYAGSFLTSLEMSGVSLSILPVDDRFVNLLDASTTASAWPNAAELRKNPKSISSEEHATDIFEMKLPSQTPQTPFGARFESILNQLAATLLAQAERFNELDRHAGDGDFGTSLARGMKQVLEKMRTWNLDEPSSTFREMSSTLQTVLGGTSGPLLAVMLLRASIALRDRSPLDPIGWADAFDASAAGVRELGGASEGDRTMLDSLAPAARAFREGLGKGLSSRDAVRQALYAAQSGATATAQMMPRLGRSSYLGARALGHKDPGAEAISSFMAILDSLLNPPE